jgi:hypothetical protein
VYVGHDLAESTRFEAAKRADEQGTGEGMRYPASECPSSILVALFACRSLVLVIAKIKQIRDPNDWLEKGLMISIYEQNPRPGNCMSPFLCCMRI